MLRRLARVKGSANAAPSGLGDQMVQFYKQSVQRRQTKLAQLAERWVVLVPQTLSDHCALAGMTRGTLTVLVDNASHLFELKQLLLAGLEQQILMACRSTGLRKIVLKPGSVSEIDPAEVARRRGEW